MIGAHARNFAEWRDIARKFLAKNISPSDIQWLEKHENFLFDFEEPQQIASLVPPIIKVSKEFISLAQFAACHTDSFRWGLLYRLIWRMNHGESNLLKIATDPDVSRLLLLVKGVRRDIHKMHAFVRFNPLQSSDAEESLIAWYEPQYEILETATPFFARRFGSLHWKIVTPSGSAIWNKKKLVFDFTDNKKPILDDTISGLWQDYYGSIFNPARLNLKAMTKEMPVRNWKNLPEARILNRLIQDAPRRVLTMKPLKSEAEIPDVSNAPSAQVKLQLLSNASQGCTGCPLFEHATQAVFGEGPSDASVVMVGEQPGDEEDIAGKAFIGPAGKLLNAALEEVGIDRKSVYVTNAVKHFKFEQRGKRRVHKRPNPGEVHACRSWLRSELAVLKPKLIVCLGASAALAVLGRAIKVNEERGTLQQSSDGTDVFVTVHPSSILRAPDELKEQALQAFKEDLRVLQSFIKR